jgi:hypothetical protein
MRVIADVRSKKKDSRVKSEKHATSVKKKSLNPVWNPPEGFDVFDVRGPAQCRTISA